MHNIFRALLKSQMRQIVWRNEASVCDSVDELSFAYARQHVRACARVCVCVCACGDGCAYTRVRAQQDGRTSPHWCTHRIGVHMHAACDTLLCG